MQYYQLKAADYKVAFMSRIYSSIENLLYVRYFAKCVTLSHLMIDPNPGPPRGARELNHLAMGLAS